MSKLVLLLSTALAVGLGGGATSFRPEHLLDELYCSHMLRGAEALSLTLTARGLGQSPSHDSASQHHDHSHE